LAIFEREGGFADVRRLATDVGIPMENAVGLFPVTTVRD